VGIVRLALHVRFVDLPPRYYSRVLGLVRPTGASKCIAEVGYGRLLMCLIITFDMVQHCSLPCSWWRLPGVHASHAMIVGQIN
jgi:hypothetical protein